MFAKTWSALRATALTCAFLLLAGSVSAVDFVVPRQTIRGAEAPVELGDLMELSVSPIEDGKRPQHLVAVSYDWRVFEIVRNADGTCTHRDKRFRQDENVISFGTGVTPRRLIVECYVTYLYAVRDGERITEIGTRNQRLGTIVNIGGVPTPPGPGPAPGPAPVIPDGRFKLGKSIYDIVMARVPADANRQRAATALANSFRTISAQIAAGTLTEAKQILEQTTNSNRRALTDLGIDQAVWTPAFRDLQEAIYALYEARTINARDDWRDAWNEIATGLSQVR